jgi:hypothetical protein
VFRSALMIASAAFLAGGLPAAPNIAPPVSVTMVVSPRVRNGKQMPQIRKDDIFVKNGDQRLKVAEWVPAQNGRAGLELFILIDDASAGNLGSQLGDLRSFIQSQASSTAVGVGYARNGTVEIRQNFTTNHKLAADGLRLPMNSAGSFGSPYLSLVDLVDRWPETSNRREVILVTSGIDRARRGFNSYLNPDVDTAVNAAQKKGMIVHTLYFPGGGPWHRNIREVSNGQNAIYKLAEATGGASIFSGQGTPVSFEPYLKALQKILDNQYLLTFFADPVKKEGFQYVKVTTEIPGVDFSIPDAVWVSAAK